MIRGKKILSVLCFDTLKQDPRRLLSRKLEGKPVLAWTIEAATGSRLIDRCVISTRDTFAADYATKLGCEAPFRGPSLDECRTLPERAAITALHAVNQLPDFDLVVVINAEAPLIKTCDIDGCIQVSASCDGLPSSTVTEMHLSIDDLLILEGGRKMSRLVEGMHSDSKQAPAKLYALTNSVYSASIEYLRTQKSFITADTMAYIVPRERAWNVESKADLLIAEGFLRRVEGKVDGF